LQHDVMFVDLAQLPRDRIVRGENPDFSRTAYRLWRSIKVSRNWSNSTLAVTDWSPTRSSALPPTGDGGRARRRRRSLRAHWVPAIAAAFGRGYLDPPRLRKEGSDRPWGLDDVQSDLQDGRGRLWCSGPFRTAWQPRATSLAEEALGPRVLLGALRPLPKGVKLIAGGHTPAGAARTSRGAIAVVNPTRRSSTDG
jgi:hypothetical protein